MNTYFEQIEDYLRKDLTDAEMQSFESALSQDPLLQQELRFQQSIINGVQAARHSELKALLQQTPIPAPPLWQNIYVRLGASAMAVAAGIGALTFVLPESSTAPNTASPSTNLVATQATPKNQSTLTPITTSKTTTPKAVASNNQKTKAVTNKSVKSTASPTSFDPNDLDAVSDIEMMEKENTPLSSGTTTSRTSTKQPVSVKTIEDKSLGYRYFNNELYLHGNFSKDKYKLIHAASQNEMYLYFDNQYYLLKPGTTKITSLSAITNPKQIQRLDILRQE